MLRKIRKKTIRKSAIFAKDDAFTFTTSDVLQASDLGDKEMEESETREPEPEPEMREPEPEMRELDRSSGLSCSTFSM